MRAPTSRIRANRTAIAGPWIGSPWTMRRYVRHCRKLLDKPLPKCGKASVSLPKVRRIEVKRGMGVCGRTRQSRSDKHLASWGKMQCFVCRIALPDMGFGGHGRNVREMKRGWRAQIAQRGTTRRAREMCEGRG